MMRILFSFCLVVTCLSGCSNSAKLELHPLTGTITRNGVPVKGGGLILTPEVQLVPGMSINCSVNADGTFEGETLLTGKDGRTNGQPGVPAGKYKAIYHPANDGSRSGLEIELPDVIVLEAKANTLQLVLPVKVLAGRGEERDDVPEVEKK